MTFSFALLAILSSCTRPSPPHETTPRVSPTSSQIHSEHAESSVQLNGAAPMPGIESPSKPGAERRLLAATLQAATQELLTGHELPAGAVVLELKPNGTRPKVLVAAHTRGADSTQLALPPGSTVKPLVYASALLKNAHSLDATHECTGRLPGEPSWTCFEQHGLVALPTAISSSCNVFAWRTLDQLGWREVRSTFTAYGFGRKTGLVPTESTGLLPQPPSRSELRQFNRLVGLGHGQLRVTLLQLATAYAKLAAQLAQHPRPLKPIRDGLAEAVLSGTAQQAQTPALALLGKTGSAESHDNPPELPKPHNENGWFVALAPASQPEVVVASYVLGGGPGGQTAAPLGGRIAALWATKQHADRPRD